MAAISWDERKWCAAGKTLEQESEEPVELGEMTRRRMSWEIEESKVTRAEDSIFCFSYFDFSWESWG